VHPVRGIGNVCKLWLYVRCDKNDRAEPSSHATYLCLSELEKDECLHRLQAKYKIPRLQIVWLEKRTSESIEKKAYNSMQNSMKT